MPQKVTITKDKINGLLESQVTQPTDAVPLSMLNDLSGSIAIDISNLETEIYDLSAYVYTLSGDPIDISDLSAVVYDLSYYVYNDLSSGGGSINIGTYTDTSTTIYPTVTTLLFDASSFTLDLSGTSTIKIDIDVSGGSGEVTYSDLSYLLFDKPLISTDCSGYSTGSQNITVKWQPPSQTKAAFNFTTSSNTSADEYNYLPFINDLIIGYQVSGGTFTDFLYSTDVTGSSGFAPVKVNQLDVTNSGSSVTKSVTGTTGSNAKILLNLSNTAIGQSYQFRIAYKNNSEDTAWNYLYCPSGSYIPFGNPGPALAPTVLTINSPSYTKLDVGGSGGQYMDASLNLPWGGTIVSIGYGLDVSGQRSNNSVQVGGYSPDQFSVDVSLGWWNGSNPNYNLQNWTTNQDNVAYPEYLYNSVANTYYAVNKAEDFSRTQVYYTGPNKADGVLIPSRIAVTSDYNNFLTGTLNPTVTAGYQSYSARRRDTYASIANIYFLADNSGISFTDTSVYKLAANYGTAKTSINPGIGDLDISFVEANSMLGKTCSGEEICYIESKVTGDGAPYLNLSSKPRVGFTGQDSPVTDTSGNLTLSSSATIELGLVPVDIRKQGFYLGFDLSQVKLTDISLGVLPDICNNLYQPYKWELEQNVKKSDGNIDVSSLTPFEFNLAKKPEQNTSLSNISISVINPTLTGTAKFYGLALPTNSSDDLKFPVSFTINNLDPTWAPSDATSIASLYDVSLVYDPNGQTSYSNGGIDRQNSSWVPSGTNTTYTPTITDLTVDYTGSVSSDYNNFKYSRDISGTNYGAGEQFQIAINLRNNVTLSPTNSQSYTFSNDLSGNGKAWWWDFTWAIGYVNTPTQTQPPTSIFTLPSSTAITLMKSLDPTTISFTNSIPSDFDGSNLLTYETAMWAKDGWFGDSSASNPFDGKEYPYIDFSSNFYSLNEDYSVYDGSGSTFDISYGNNINTLSTSQTTLSYTNVKWLVFKVLWTSVSAGQKLNFTVSGSKGNGSSQTLQWPNDYILFYLEQDLGGSPAYTVNTGGGGVSSSYTPWLDVQNSSRAGSQRNSFQYAQGFSASSKGQNNGANVYGSGSSGSGPFTGINRFRVGTAQINQYLAFGLMPGIKFTGLTITFG